MTYHSIPRKSFFLTERLINYTEQRVRRSAIAHFHRRQSAEPGLMAKSGVLDPINEDFRCGLSALRRTPIGLRAHQMRQIQCRTGRFATVPADSVANLMSRRFVSEGPRLPAIAVGVPEKSASPLSFVSGPRLPKVFGGVTGHADKEKILLRRAGSPAIILRAPQLAEIDPVWCRIHSTFISFYARS